MLQLARERPLDSISVSEVAIAAGVTRDTFYRHASSVVDLLVAALSLELTAMADRYAPILANPPVTSDLVFSAESDLLRHVANNATIYRSALRAELGSPVRKALTEFVRRTLENELRLRPEIAPDALGTLDDRTIGMATAYAASGTVGAIEVWLETGELTDIEAAARVIIAASPEWWFATPLLPR